MSPVIFDFFMYLPIWRRTPSDYFVFESLFEFKVGFAESESAKVVTEEKHTVSGKERD